MTQAFENMLYLLGAGARGYEVSAADMDMEEVRKCAAKQGVWPIVYKAAEKTADVSRWRGEFIFTIARYVSRRDYTLSIMKKLEAAGIPCCLMKGASVAMLYAQPECRISGDTDIYINPADEQKVMGILKENGYEVIPRAKTDHHLKAKHPVGGLLEVHVRVHSKTSEDVVFNGHVSYSGDYETLTIDGNDYLVMNANDKLVYLTAHYINHLVNDGCGIRQIMDLLLFMEKNKDRIDFDKYNALLKELKYDKLIDVIKSIGAVYFGYDYPVCDKALMDKLLTDTENGGTFGYMADDRANFYDMYCAKRTQQSRMKHAVYMSLNKERNIFARFFPNQRYLVNNGYSYAKHTVLVPFAWINRLFDVALRRKREYGANKAAGERASKRLEMMKELGMIE